MVSKEVLALVFQLHHCTQSNAMQSYVGEVYFLFSELLKIVDSSSVDRLIGFDGRSNNNKDKNKWGKMHL